METMKQHRFLRNKLTGDYLLTYIDGNGKRHDERFPSTAESQARARLRAICANEVRRERDQLMRDIGLNKVKGAVSGRTYWE